MSIENKNADISRIALYWDERTEQWQLLSVGESQEEIDARARYWEGKGTQNIKIFAATDRTNNSITNGN